jgi:hypothetical protein
MATTTGLSRSDALAGISRRSEDIALCAACGAGTPPAVTALHPAAAGSRRPKVEHEARRERGLGREGQRCTGA